MTVADLIAKLSVYPPDTRVTLLHPEERWLLPIEITRLPADRCTCGVDLVAITTNSASDEIEGVALKLSELAVTHGKRTKNLE